MSAPERNGAGDRIGEQLSASADAATQRPIDVDAVLAASRARRRSRRGAILGGTAAAAVVLGLGGAVLGLSLGVGGIGVSTTAGDGALSEAPAADTMPEAGSESAEGDALGFALVPPELANRCGEPVTAPPDAGAVPLTVAVTAPQAVEAGASATAIVTVTNTSDAAVSGQIRLAPALTVAEAGVTVWHSSGEADPLSRSIELAPGASIELTGDFEARRCGEGDDRRTSLPADLPALSPGAYGMAAIVVFTDVAHGGAVDHLVSPLAAVDVVAH
ncbi:hypothetical protein [Agromyces subbeticus]|uniref:hypothetical protein n=1 Tax=Agromyces subbeticus TaxID=293890 RepID=UPI0003B775E6|nr:hypothetical protein [Agromyces subbeticus]